jgi:hypothetical protein
MENTDTELHTWNYRVLETEFGLAIHEVHYNAAGVPLAWTTEPSHPFGETFDELVLDARYHSDALRRPVLVLDPSGDRLVDR